MQLNDLPPVLVTLFIYYTKGELHTFNFNIQNFQMSAYLEGKMDVKTLFALVGWVDCSVYPVSNLHVA